MDEPKAVTVPEPIPISLVSNRYLLYDVNAITYLRRQYHICGVLIGSLPHFPQQNIFLGVPLELMPEEARLLVEKGVATIVDDVNCHTERLRGLSKDEQMAFLKCLEKEGMELARGAERLAERKKEEALRKVKHAQTKAQSPTCAGHAMLKGEASEQEEQNPNDLEDNMVFDSSIALSGKLQESASDNMEIERFHITPTTSIPIIRPPTPPATPRLPDAPPSYPLFAHLHAKDYYISPGLRFGCQYLVYPGDPLRFHSHFLAASSGWEDEFDLIDIVAGGRLGTGVKKGYLIGGVEDAYKHPPDAPPRVRTFCIEWGGM